MIQKQENQFQSRLLQQEKENPYLLFAERIQRRYAWEQTWQIGLSVPIRYRKQEAGKSVTVSVNQPLIERMIERYMPRAIERTGPVIQRRDRSRLLSVIEEISHQDGERKQLEQLIFRKKEEEWKRNLHVQEEQVRLIQEEIRKQRRILETVVHRVEEPALDTNHLFTEFRKKLEQQLRLERLRAGL